MTLRSRMALALGVLAALASFTVAAVAYVATSSRLQDELDTALTESAATFGQPFGYRVLCETGTSEPDVPSFPYRPGPGREVISREVERALRDVSAVQCLDPEGAIVARTEVQLPVDDLDRRLAADGAGSRTRTVAVDGDEFRVETVGVADEGAVQLARDYGETARVLASLRTRLIAVGLLVTAAAAAVGWWIARQATRPLARLTDAAEEVAGTGQLDVELPAGGSDEPGRLARSFGAMLAALRRSREQQQQLVQDAGHELRTPLTSLRTNVELLQRHRDLPDETRDAILRDLHTESVELATLVDELVQLATDQWDDEPEQRLDLGELVTTLAHRAERRTGRPVPVTAGDAPVWVVGRPRDLARAIGNLIDNAAKFSPEGTPVEVRVEPGRVVVRDHGPGVAPEDRTKVFDRFYRAPSARSLPGSGLGLSIVEQTARTHGGSVTVADHPEGGAVFTLHLPPAA